MRHARFRAFKTSLPFDLDRFLPEIQGRIDKGICEVSGLHLNLDGGLTWDSPSLDRIVPSKGYLYSNIRVVCHAVNSALGSWGDAKMLEIARAILSRRRDASNALSERLGQRLMQNLEGRGSPLFNLTWKRSVTRSGHVIYRLRASARRTSDSDSGGWPTPVAKEQHDTPEKMQARGMKPGLNFTTAAKLTSWVTPSARDWKDTAGMSVTGTNPDGTERTRVDQLPRQAVLASWLTPQANNATRGGSEQRASSARSSDLHDSVQLLAAPQSRAVLPSLETLGGPMRITAAGTVLTGSSAAMASSGQLNPALSRWLMGYPPAWDACGVTAMPSSRNSRRSSSRPTRKPADAAAES